MTLFTLASDKNTNRYMQTISVYLILTLFLILFGAVYERFSHEVYSYYMLYAFVFPLTGGVLSFVLMMKFGAAYPSAIISCCYHAGIASMTIGSLICGILEIYGTTNPLTVIYWIVGASLTMAAILIYASLLLILRRAKASKLQSE